MSKMINQVLGPNPRVHLVLEAEPWDFLKCIEENVYSEILFAAHTSISRYTADPSTLKRKAKHELVFFRPLNPYEKLEKSQKMLPSLEAKLNELQESPWTPVFENQRCQDSLEPQTCHENVDQISVIRKKIDLLRNHSNSLDLYHQEAIDPYLFNKARDKLTRIRDTEGEVTLKQIRFLSCDVKSTFLEYPALVQLLHDNKIRFDSSPSQPLTSFLYGYRTSTLNSAWISETGQPDREQKDNLDTFVAFIPLKTHGVWRFGSGIALKGRYQIEVKGAALGWSSKYFKIRIPYEKVKDLEIGESQSFWMPHLDFSFAVWPIYFDAGIQEGIHLARYAETQGIGGFELGFASKVSIKRLY